MSLWRYSSCGFNALDLDGYVTGAGVVPVSPTIYIDIELEDDNQKPALDDRMLTLGWAQVIE